MKVYVAKLLIFFNIVGIHFLWLIVQLIALRETVTAGFSTEAKHSLKILRELSESNRGKLVKLHPKLQQNISQHQLRQHPEPIRKELLKHDSHIVGWIQNNFFTRLTHRTFDKIAQSLQLSDAADSNGRGPKVIAPLRLTRIHDPAFFVLIAGAIFGSVTRVTSRRGTDSSSLWPGHLRFASHNFLRNRRTLSFHHSKHQKCQSSTTLAAKA
jgi:hypothetical protein